MKPLNTTDMEWLKLFFLGPNDRPGIPAPILRRLLRLELVYKVPNDVWLTDNAKRLFGWEWSKTQKTWITPKGWKKPVSQYAGDRIKQQR